VVPGRLVPFETKVLKVLGTLDRTLKDVNQILTRVHGDIVPEVRRVLGTLDQTLKDANRMVNHVDGEIVPEVKKTLKDLQRSIVAAQRVLASTQTTLTGPDAPAQQELHDALQELTRAARAIRELSGYLERNPSAIIRGKTQEKTR
jgi:paraquat-inducible protein B